MSKSDEIAMAPLVTMLSRDIFCQHVLDFCHRDDTKLLMRDVTLDQSFDLRADFCDDHGSRFESNYQPPCIDCRMELEDHFRCDQCDDFSHIDDLDDGVCGATLCESCGHGLMCEDCALIFHQDCSDCGSIGVCNVCHSAFCSSCRELEACDGCDSIIFCSECADDEGFRCRECSKLYCDDCMADNGDMYFCELCNEVCCTGCSRFDPCVGCGCHACFRYLDSGLGDNRCSECADRSCEDCFIVHFCHSCDEGFCHDCKEVSCCDACDNYYCTDCRSVEFCYVCDIQFCEACAEESGWKFCFGCQRTSCAKCDDTATCALCKRCYCSRCDVCTICDACDVILCGSCAADPLPSCCTCAKHFCLGASCSRCNEAYCDNCSRRDADEDTSDFVCKSCLSEVLSTNRFQALALWDV
jgi:hypothetical protein